MIITSLRQPSRSVADLDAAAIPCPVQFFPSLIRDVAGPLLLSPLADPWVISL